jgi:hypothetical protein
MQIFFTQSKKDTYLSDQFLFCPHMLCIIAKRFDLVQKLSGLTPSLTAVLGSVNLLHAEQLAQQV